MFLPFLLLFFARRIHLHLSMAMASDTISAGQSLSGNQTLISQGGNFELGFFSPGSSPNHYIGIWYKNLPGNKTVFWVANRENPVSNTSAAELKISQDGNLVILDSSNSIIWSSNSATSSAATAVVVLLDSGNLVVESSRLDSASVIWQSFDHPTDTWMPGGRLGMNKITNVYQSCTAWKSPDDPAPGPFSQSLDPDGSNQYVLLWNGSQVYWTSGLWNGQFFANVPGTGESTGFNLTFTDEPDRKFSMYTVTVSSFITRSVMSSDGQLRQWLWLDSTRGWQTVFTQPLAQCDVYSLCGPFGICEQEISSNLCSCPVGFEPVSDHQWLSNNWNSGCRRKTNLKCDRNLGNGANRGANRGKEDGFLPMAHVRLPANPQSSIMDGDRECKEACLASCSCSGYSYGNGRCSIWDADLRNLQKNYDGDISASGMFFLRLASSDLPHPTSKRKLIIAVTSGVLAGILLLLACLLGINWASRKQRSDRLTKQNHGSSIKFTYGDLQHVTKNFSHKLAVSVSLLAPDSNPSSEFPLDNLVNRCAMHYGFTVSNRLLNMPGSYFAVASVFHSQKVMKNSVHLSWGLACTMGFPTVDRMVFICPIEKNSSYTNICKCKSLYLNLLPPKSLSDNAVSDSVSKEREEVDLEKTPSQSKSSSFTVSSKCLDIPCLDFSSIRLSLDDVKLKELLQLYAIRWLYGRHFLKGNVVTVPICGQICVFMLEKFEMPNAGCLTQGLVSKEYNWPINEVKISQPSCQAVTVLAVDTGTRVHLSTSIVLKTETPPKVDFPAEDFRNEDILEKETGNVQKLGGLSKEIAALKNIISLSLSQQNIALTRYKGVLLHGPPGTGITSLACFCAHDAGVSVFTINGSEIITQDFGEAEQTMHRVFQSARQAAPALIFIDEVDAIAPAREEGGEESSLSMVATLLTLMDEISRTDCVFVIAATNYPDSIDPALRRPGRFDREIEIGIPSQEQRFDILQTLLKKTDISLKAEDIRSIAYVSHGFAGADLAALVDEAAFCALNRHIQLKQSFQLKWGAVLDRSLDDTQSNNLQKNVEVPSAIQINALASSLSSLSMSQEDISGVSLERIQKSWEELEKLHRKVNIDDFNKAKAKIKPSGMHGIMFKIPNVRWEDVGGQDKVKNQLIEAVQMPQSHPDVFKHIGIRPPRGLLMIGPPGCSKTLMARAVASEAKLNFLAVKGPELFNKWVGESEKAVRDLFAKARANSPAIIFFDEIDGLAVTRGNDDDGISVSDRVLSQLLQEMDGLNQRAGVTVIATTNQPDKIDSALLRPGRFDRILAFQPTDLIDRHEIFCIHIRKNETPCSPDVDLKELAHLTEGYTGADIMQICREAVMAAIDENKEAAEVSQTHFKIGISKAQPKDFSVYWELSAQFRRMVG